MPNEVDVRTPHTDALDTLGTVLRPDAKRDAIHLAVEPIVAGMDMQPGTHVFLDGNVAYIVGTETTNKPIGIVDPFLEDRVAGGEMFWLFLYPGSITTLRHVWEAEGFQPLEMSDAEITNKYEEIQDRLDEEQRASECDGCW
jgi:hypothetical protein